MQTVSTTIGKQRFGIASPLSYLKDLTTLFALHRLTLCLGTNANAAELHSWFTAPHSRLPMFGNKTIGVQLLDLHAHANFDNYLKSINGKNSAAYYRRKALSKGYAFGPVLRNRYIDDIHAINLSMERRQGRKMHPMYLEKVTHYDDAPDWLYFGVTNADGQLTAYLNIQLAGDVAVVRTLLGHGRYLNDGIMYLLLIEAARYLYELRGPRYLMYDMYFGTGAGLRLFKAKLGFRPFWVRWRTPSLS